jgi:hypothetical protein
MSRDTVKTEGDCGQVLVLHVSQEPRSITKSLDSTGTWKSYHAGSVKSQHR